MKTVVSAAKTTTTTISGNSSTATTLSSANVASKPETSLPCADSPVQFQAPTAAVGSASSASSGINKRPITLDLNKLPPAKKQRLVAPLNIESPDLANLKNINTPDIETLVLSSNLLQTPQPGVVFPTKVGPVTSEQEAFGKGFEDALHSLHNSKKSQTQVNTGSTANAAAAAPAIPTAATTTSTASTGMSGGSFTYANLENNFPVTIKEEPQNPSTSPPVSPIDMETQEKIKLERKRMRNRVAASKCRKRKLERISKLEDKVKQLKGENGDLGLVVKSLKDHVAQLKQQVIDHIESGCSLSPLASAFNGSAMLQSK